MTRASKKEAKTSKKLLIKTIGVSTCIMLFALVFLGIASLVSKQALALNSTLAMGANKLRGDMQTFKHLIEREYGDLSLKDGQLVDSKNKPMEHRYEIVDFISKDVGVEATIYAKDGDDYRRIATSLIDSAGERSVDSYLGPNSPAFSFLQSGREYIGKTVIFGNDYITEYHPIFESGTENVIGALFIGVDLMPIEKMIKEKSNAQTGITVGIGFLLFFMIVGADVLNMRRVVTVPISKVTNSLKDISDGEGNLTQRIDFKSNDEIGDLVRYFNKFMDAIQGPIGEAKNTIEGLAAAAEEFSTVSHQLTNSSQETLKQATGITDRTERMSENINAMASGAEQSSVNANQVATTAKEMSTNMNTITVAIEDMTSSIGEIAENAQEANKVANEATEKSNKTSDVMNKLGTAAKEIGKVTYVIKKIADKTNLLALNATIEAASAGEAGKGFAVVANEIKELANQSALSADDIASRIESIQNGTNDAINAIDEISKIIVKISRSVKAIDRHVGQQTRASNEITNNVTQANEGAKRVAGAIYEVAKGSNDIAKNAGDAARRVTQVSSDINSMSDAAKESNHGAGQVNSSANDLAKMADRLRAVVGKFKV